MYEIIAALIIDHTYDKVDEFPKGDQSVADIINLKQLHNLLNELS